MAVSNISFVSFHFLTKPEFATCILGEIASTIYPVLSVHATWHGTKQKCLCVMSAPHAYGEGNGSDLHLSVVLKMEQLLTEGIE